MSREERPRDRLLGIDGTVEVSESRQRSKILEVVQGGIKRQGRNVGSLRESRHLTVKLPSKQRVKNSLR